MKAYVKYLFLFSLGVFCALVYTFEKKLTIVNAAIVATYANTSFGHETLRLMLHDECYFGAQHIALNRGATSVEIEYDQWCWEEAEKTIKYLKQGELPQ